MHAVVKHLVSFTVAVLFLLPVPARAGGEKDIVRATLKNGLRVVIVRNVLAPLVTTEVNYLAGSNEAPEGFPGMAHAEEHMMFRGSPGLSASQFSTISAALGGDSNAASFAAVPDASRVQDEVMLAETLGVTRGHPDHYTLQVGNHVLAGAFYATRLYRDLREETGLVYFVQAMLDAGKTRAAYSVFYGCDPGNVSKARALVERDLREIQTKPVSPDELRQAKTLLIRKIPLSESSVDGIAGTLLDLSQKELPLDEPVRAAERYRGITAEQVRAAFRKWVRPADFVQVTLGPEGK